MLTGLYTLAFIHTYLNHLSLCDRQIFKSAKL